MSPKASARSLSACVQRAIADIHCAAALRCRSPCSCRSRFLDDAGPAPAERRLSRRLRPLAALNRALTDGTDRDDRSRAPLCARKGAMGSPIETTTGAREETPPISVGGPGWKYINRAIPSYRLACGLETRATQRPSLNRVHREQASRGASRPARGSNCPFARVDATHHDPRERTRATEQRAQQT